MSIGMETALLQKIRTQLEMSPSAPLAIKSTGYLQSIASCAQQRIWFNEKLHHDLSTPSAINNALLPIVIKDGSMSIEYIRSAIVTILEQHMVLRTAIYFDEKSGQLKQEVQPTANNDSYSFQLSKNVQSLQEIKDLLKNEFVNPFAQLDRGLVVRCHLVKRSFDDNKESLYENDIIVFVFHRIAFDYNSAGPFITAFTQAYDRIEPDVTRLQYIDFTLYEHKQLTKIAQDSKIDQMREFWLKLMHDYNRNENLSMLTTSAQGTRIQYVQGHRITFDLESSIVEAQIESASLHDVSMFHMNLACYFIFLRGLDSGKTNDLCVACPIDNRSLPEMKSMIGMLMNLLPYRIQIDPNACFRDFVQQVRNLCDNILQYAQLPYEEIMRNTGDLCSIEIPFHFHYDSINALSVDEIALKSQTRDATLNLYIDQEWLHSENNVFGGLTLTMIVNHHERKTHCVLECPIGCNDESALSNISIKFKSLLSHLFIKKGASTGFDQCVESVEKILLELDKNKLSDTVQRLCSITKQGTAYSKDRSAVATYVRLTKINSTPSLFEYFSLI